MAIALTQSRYAFRSDTLTVDSASYVFPVGENNTWVPSPIQQYVPFRIRFEIFNTGSTTVGATTYRIFAQKNGAGGYTQVNSSRTDGIVTSTAATTDPDNTALLVSRLTNDAPGTPAFVNGEIDTNGATSNITLGVGSTTAQKTEIEFGLMLTSAAVPGDYFDFRVYRATSTALNTYTQTPRMTVSLYGFQATPIASAAASLGTPAPIGAWTFNSANGQNSGGAPSYGISTGTSAVVNAPLNITAGDLIICALAVVDQTGGVSDPGTITLPDGSWTLAAGDLEDSPFNGNLRYIIAYKTATASEPASYTFTWTNSSGYNWWINTFTPPVGESWTFDAVFSNKVNTSGGEVSSWSSATLSGLNSDKLDVAFIFSIDRGGQATYHVPAGPQTLYLQQNTNADYGNIVAMMLNPVEDTSVGAYTFTSQYATSPTTTAIAFHASVSGAIALTATNLATGAASFDQPVLVYNVGLAANNLATGADAFTQPALNTTYSFTANNLASAAAFFSTPGSIVNRNLTASNLATGGDFLGSPLLVVNYNTDSAVSLASGADALGTPLLATTYSFTANNIASAGASIGGAFVGESGAVIIFSGPSVANNQSPSLDTGTVVAQSIVTYAEAASNVGNQSPALDNGQVSISSVTSPFNFLAPDLASKAAAFTSPALIATIIGAGNLATGGDVVGVATFGQIDNLHAVSLATAAASFDTPSISVLGASLNPALAIAANIAQINQALAGLQQSTALQASLGIVRLNSAVLSPTSGLSANLNPYLAALASAAISPVLAARLVETGLFGSALSPASALTSDLRRFITPTASFSVGVALSVDLIRPQLELLTLSAVTALSAFGGIAIADQATLTAGTTLSSQLLKNASAVLTLAPVPTLGASAIASLSPLAGMAPVPVLSSAMGAILPVRGEADAYGTFAAQAFIFASVRAGLGGIVSTSVSENLTGAARGSISPYSVLSAALAAELPTGTAFSPSTAMAISEFVRPQLDITLEGETGIQVHETSQLAPGPRVLAPEPVLNASERMLLTQPPFVASSTSLLSVREYALYNEVLRLAGEAMLLPVQASSDLAAASEFSDQVSLYSIAQHMLAGQSTMGVGLAYLWGQGSLSELVSGDMAPAVFMDARLGQIRIEEISAVITGQAYGGKIIAQGNLIIEVE